MKSDTCKEQLLDQQLALSAYLDVMLQGEMLQGELALQAETPVHVQVVAAAPAELTPAVEQAEGATTGSESGVPGWASTRFQALLFEVAGLTLAVPLIKLKGVVPNEAGLTPMPGHSPLFPGIVPYQGANARVVVDTARFILPQDRTEQLDADFAQRSAHLVMIDEGRWALACDAIGEVIELESKDVKWRGANARRVWLAGTVIEQMCALLDIDALTEELANGLA
jgi:purine-binding chemotaxis protein CheW